VVAVDLAIDICKDIDWSGNQIQSCCSIILERCLVKKIRQTGSSLIKEEL
jgi:hypothetical protein